MSVFLQIHPKQFAVAEAFAQERYGCEFQQMSFFQVKELVAALFVAMAHITSRYSGEVTLTKKKDGTEAIDNAAKQKVRRIEDVTGEITIEVVGYRSFFHKYISLKTEVLHRYNFKE